MSGSLRRAAPFLCLLALAACAPGRAEEPPRVLAQPVQLHSEREELDQIGRLAYVAGFALASRDPRFGGLSALWIERDGSSLITVSDRGPLWTADLHHAADGTLTDLRHHNSRRIAFSSAYSARNRP